MQRWNLYTWLVLGVVEKIFRVCRVFESFTVCAFSSTFTEFVELNFLQLELLPLRVVTVVKV